MTKFVIQLANYSINDSGLSISEWEDLHSYLEHVLLKYSAMISPQYPEVKDSVLSQYFIVSFSQEDEGRENSEALWNELLQLELVKSVFRLEPVDVDE